MFQVALKPPFYPEPTLVVSMQVNLAPYNEISSLMKNCSKASMTFETDSKEPTTLLNGINDLIPHC